jgi:hypothetical protein
MPAGLRLRYNSWRLTFYRLAYMATDGNVFRSYRNRRKLRVVLHSKLLVGTRIIGQYFHIGAIDVLSIPLYGANYIQRVFG